MSYIKTEKHKTLLAGETLAKHRVVKLSGATFVLAGDEEVVEAVGVTIDAAANGAPVNVKLFNDSGTFLIEAVAACTAGAKVTCEASGKVSDDGTLVLGYATETVSADEFVEMIVTKV